MSTELAIKELMTGTGLRSRMNEISDRAAEIKGEAAWQSELAELCRTQAQEIDRLNLALQDASAVPPRRPLLATGGIAVGANNMARSIVTAIDDHGAVWTIMDGGRGSAWTRLPDLPAPLEIAKTLQTPDEIAADAAARADLEQRRAELAERNRGFNR